MAETISSSVIACLRDFNAFIEEIQQYSYDEKPEGLHVQTWQDELGRLRMWAANIGAHQIGQSSLDFRLRDSSHIRQQIVKLLTELLGRLQDARSNIEEGEDDDVESLKDSSSDNEDPQTEIQQLRGSVATIINCLFQMSMLVRKPAQHDLRKGSTKIDVTAFEPFDYDHVRNKYPTANEQIVSRLGRAITLRRKYLRYRERHALKLKQGIDNGNMKQSGDGRSEVLSATIATDVQNWNVDFDDRASESGLSQTSYAPTLMSGGNITIPAPPRASHGGIPFECPYCYFVISVSSTRSWNQHVFNDLQPYVCTEIQCPTPDKLYSTRHEWLQHLRKTHHRDESSQVASKNHNSDRERECPLCRSVLRNTETYNRHMARHHQELALFILPRNEEYSDEEERHSDTACDASRTSSFHNQTHNETERISMPKSDTRDAHVLEGLLEASGARHSETMPPDQQTSTTASPPASASSFNIPEVAPASSLPSDSTTDDPWTGQTDQKVFEKPEEWEQRDGAQERLGVPKGLEDPTKILDRDETGRTQEAADAEGQPDILSTIRFYDANKKEGERHSELMERAKESLKKAGYSKESIDKILKVPRRGSNDYKRRTYVEVHRKRL